MGRGRGSAVAVLVTTGAGVLVLLWAAGSEVPLLSFPEATVAPPAPGEEAPVTAPPQTAPGVETGPPQRRPGVPWDLVLALLVTLTVLGLVVRLVLRLAREGRGEADEEQEGGAELAALVSATSPGQRARAATEEDPRNAVVACWVALEQAAARSGLPRDPAETSLEFTTRVLARWDVRRDPLGELAALYREARFSRHPVTEEQRDRALAALAAIHADLREAR